MEKFKLQEIFLKIKYPVRSNIIYHTHKELMIFDTISQSQWYFIQTNFIQGKIIRQSTLIQNWSEDFKAIQNSRDPIVNQRIFKIIYQSKI
ncbi:hypothetical protein pb186bvf_002833 [Paramecium bursaria]